MRYRAHIGLKVSLVALLVVGSGCNRIKLVYGWADTYVESEITDYLDLTSAQNDQMEHAVDGYFDWHRHAELPKFSREFGTMADLVEHGQLDEAAFGRSFTAIDGLFRESVEHCLRPSAELLASQKGEQIDHFAHELANREKELRKEDARSEKKKVKERYDQSAKFFEGFVGPLTEDQKTALRANIVKTLGDRSSMWIDNRTFHVAQLLGAMRRDEGVDAITVVLDHWWLRRGPQLTPAHAAASEAAMTHLREGMWQILSTLTPEQNAHLVTSLRGYQRDLTDLSRESS